MSQDNRQTARTLESQLLLTSEQALTQLSAQLQRVLVQAIIDCPTAQCLQSKMQPINQLNRHANAYVRYLSDNLEECISREFNNLGVDGYTKCFGMFEKVIRWESRHGLADDPKISRGRGERKKSAGDGRKQNA